MNLLTGAVQVISIFRKLKILGNLLRKCPALSHSPNDLWAQIDLDNYTTFYFFVTSALLTEAARLLGFSLKSQ